jgi:CheY-like chemotaxis protein
MVTTDLTATDHFVWGDPVRLEQVFWNLINNALKFTGPGGEIRLQTWNQDGQLHFAITDTGIGIEVGKQEKLFKAFEQGERGTARRFGGLGLGLAICKNLVERHDGTISISSRGRGFGTTATVILKPHLDPATNLVAPEPAAGEPKGGMKILLVDDHADTQRVLASLLRRFGYEVSVAGSVKEALDIFSSQSIDAILSDIGLPDGNGYDIISEAKRIRAVKGVALTGYGMSEDVRRSTEAGFDFHLTKPVDVAELRSVLHKLSSRG